MPGQQPQYVNYSHPAAAPLDSGPGPLVHQQQTYHPPQTQYLSGGTNPSGGSGLAGFSRSQQMYLAQQFGISTGNSATTHGSSSQAPAGFDTNNYNAAPDSCAEEDLSESGPGEDSSESGPATNLEGMRLEDVTPELFELLSEDELRSLMERSSGATPAKPGGPSQSSAGYKGKPGPSQSGIYVQQKTDSDESSLHSWSGNSLQAVKTAVTESGDGGTTSSLNSDSGDSGPEPNSSAGFRALGRAEILSTSSSGPGDVGPGVTLRSKSTPNAVLTPSSLATTSASDFSSLEKGNSKGGGARKYKPEIRPFGGSTTASGRKKVPLLQV